VTPPEIGSFLLCEEEQRVYEVCAHVMRYSNDVTAVVVDPPTPLTMEEIGECVFGREIKREISLVKIQAGQWRPLSPLELLAREG
jgi:hypothetical protein